MGSMVREVKAAIVDQNGHTLQKMLSNHLSCFEYQFKHSLLYDIKTPQNLFHNDEKMSKSQTMK